jgi:O-methyltransferase
MAESHGLETAMSKVVEAGMLLLERLGAGMVGFSRRRRAASRAAEGGRYEPLWPVATYAPWSGDRDFVETYEAVRDHTMVDRYRCWELWMLVEQVARLDGALIEVGTWRGGSGALIARRAELCGISAKVYLCDTFAGIVKAGSRDSSYRGGELADTSADTVADLVHRRLGLDNVEILEGVFPEEVAHRIADERFRLCHVDVDVYRSARDVTEWVWDKLPAGGVVVYDDYGFPDCDGVTAWVEEQKLAGDRLTVYNLNGHAVVVKTG